MEKDTVKEEVKKQVREGRIYSWESRRTMHFEAQVNAESGIVVGFEKKGSQIGNVQQKALLL